MKKLIAFCLFFASLFGFSFIPISPQNDLFSLNGIFRACFVTEEIVEADNVVETMNYNYVYVDKQDLSNYNEFDAEAIVLYFDSITKQELVKSLDMLVFKEEKIGEYEIIYGYTTKYKDFKLIDNKRVNVQIVETKNQLIAGFPMILTGF